MIPPAACEKALSRSAASVRRRPSADFHAADFHDKELGEQLQRRRQQHSTKQGNPWRRRVTGGKAKEADNKKSSWAEEHRRWTAKRLTNMRAPGGQRGREKKKEEISRGSQRFQIEEIIQGKRRLWKGSRREEDGDKVYWDRRCLTLNFPMRRFSCHWVEGIRLYRRLG